MARFEIQPTQLDLVVANQIAAHTNPAIERVAQTLTWGADEHVICLAAATWWLYCRKKPDRQRRLSNHILLCSVASSLLPHLLKTVFAQERPDRRTVRGHWRGVPISGERYDAFPSGHAIHVGALAAAITPLRASQRRALWILGTVLVTTRIVLLAHWLSDVAAGLAIGALGERLLRRMTLKPSDFGHDDVRASAGPPSDTRG